MLVAEAGWLRERLAALGDQDFPLLNVGSSTGEFRTTEQPWVDAEVFAPLRHRGRSVVHLDIKPQPGVDLVADFLDPGQDERIAEAGARSVLCSNLLEHLPVAPADAVRRLCGHVPPGGHLILTVPEHYPLHEDPIDNGFRPTPELLARLLPAGWQVLEARTVRCHRLGWYYAGYGTAGTAFAARMAVPVLRPREWWALASSAGSRARQACLHAIRPAAD